MFPNQTLPLSKSIHVSHEPTEAPVLGKVLKSHSVNVFPISLNIYKLDYLPFLAPVILRTVSQAIPINAVSQLSFVKTLKPIHISSSTQNLSHLPGHKRTLTLSHQFNMLCLILVSYVLVTVTPKLPQL